MNVCNAGNCHNGAYGSFLYFYLFQAVKFIEFADFYFAAFIFVMCIDNNDILVYFDGAIINFTNTDAPYIFVIINGAD